VTAKFFAHLRVNFFSGLAVLLPAVISIAIVVWLFGTVANITDTLLFLVPREWKYVDGRGGQIHWYWSVVALLLAAGLITLVGRLTRFYVGKKLIQASDALLLRVPLLNKIYATTKQVKEAFSGNKSSFKQAVLVEFPRRGLYSLGFITSEQRNEVQSKTAEQVWSVFVPTTPNPTTGFLVFVPESELVRLDMSVAEAIKTIISLGAVTPEYLARLPALPAQESGLVGPAETPATGGKE
jgi:uncharacterized membrane protein